MGLAMVLATNQLRSSNTRNESRSLRSPLNRVAPWLRLIIFLVFTASGMAVTEFCARAFSTEEPVTEAQIYNQKPQAQYNEKQTGPKSFWGKAKDNLPALGAILGAVGPALPACLQRWRKGIRATFTPRSCSFFRG